MPRVVAYPNVIPARCPHNIAHAASKLIPVAPRWRSLMCANGTRKQAEGLALLKAENNTTGYFGVCHKPGRPKPYLV